MDMHLIPVIVIIIIMITSYLVAVTFGKRDNMKVFGIALIIMLIAVVTLVTYLSILRYLNII